MRLKSNWISEYKKLRNYASASSAQRCKRVADALA